VADHRLYLRPIRGRNAFQLLIGRPRRIQRSERSIGHGLTGLARRVVSNREALLSARERMDIISAYREVGTYRGAAEICATTHKTVRRVIERAEAGDARPSRRPGSATTNRWPRWSLRRTVGFRRSGCCRSRRRPAMAGRSGTSAVWSRRRNCRGGGIITADAAQLCESRAASWCSTGRRSAPGCTCFAPFWRGRGGGSSGVSPLLWTRD